MNISRFTIISNYFSGFAAGGMYGEYDIQLCLSNKKNCMGMNAVSYTTPVFPIDLQRSEKLVSCEFYLLDISLIQSVSREIKKNEHIETV